MTDRVTAAALHRFDLARLPVRAWKNGGGRTRVLATCPAEAGPDDFDWRVSVASIAASGPFSRYPGVDRHLVLLEGEGVHLRGEGIDFRLDRRLSPFAFSGDLELDSRLLGGPSTDFNVMTRRDKARAEVSVRTGTFAANAAEGLVLVVEGEWSLCANGPAGGPGRDAPAGSPEAPAGSAEAAARATGPSSANEALRSGQGLWWIDPSASPCLSPKADGATLLSVRWTRGSPEPSDLR